MERKETDIRWSLGLKCSTGFESLDKMLGGGARLGSVSLIACTVSAARDRFLIELAANEMKRGYGVIYITTDRTGRAIEEEIRKKVSKSTYSELLVIIDTISTMLEDRYVPPIKYSSIPNDFSRVDKMVDECFNLLRKRGIAQQVLIFDSVDKPLRLVNGHMNVYKILLSIQILLEGYSAPGFFVINPRMHQTMVLRSINGLSGSFIVVDNKTNQLLTMTAGSKRSAKFLTDRTSFKIL